METSGLTEVHGSCNFNFNNFLINVKSMLVRSPKKSKMVFQKTEMFMGKKGMNLEFQRLFADSKRVKQIQGILDLCEKNIF